MLRSTDLLNAGKTMSALGQPRTIAMYAICRAKSSEAWKVAFRRNGAYISRSFSFSVYGGEQLALLRAQLWRDEKVRANPPVSRKKRAEILLSTNRSGIAGVSRQVDEDGTLIAWMAKTTVSQYRVVSKYFSVSKFGANEAKRLAIAARQEQLKLLPGLSLGHTLEAVIRNKPVRALPALPKPARRGDWLRRDSSSGVPGVQLVKTGEGLPHYWKVSVTRDGKKLGKTFSVEKYGFEQARALAVATRQMRPFGTAPARSLVAEPRRVNGAEIARTNNTSGIVGVALKRYPEGAPKEWFATGVVNGKPLTKFFSIAKYGDEEALTLAIMARLDHLQQRTGLKNPVASWKR
jgi:hypothetical protein